MLLLCLFMLVSIIYLVIVYMEWDRTINLYFHSYDYYLHDYQNKPRAHSNRRVIILYRDSNVSSQIPTLMFKSLLDQSVKVDDITIQTSLPEKFKDVLAFSTTHVPGTELISEGEDTTIIIPVMNKVYPYEFVETYVESKQ